MYSKKRQVSSSMGLALLVADLNGASVGAGAGTYINHNFNITAQTFSKKVFISLVVCIFSRLNFKYQIL
jgi:hypothetical protein